MKRHLLVTNDYPPKVGGIQNYLWELWRRLPEEQVTILTPDHGEASEFDREQGQLIVRNKRKVLLPTKALAAEINELANKVGAEIIVLDPALPLGHLGPALDMPYAIVAHGAEITFPGRLPIAKRFLRRVILGADFVIAAGGYPAREVLRAAGQHVPTIEIPPGVDPTRFTPLDGDSRSERRQRFGLTDAPLVVGISRLVPRKGFDRAVQAVSLLRHKHENLQLAIAGGGRDAKRLERLARKVDLPVTFLGRVDDSDMPSVFAMGDVFLMPCRNRWGGLEQEGFGIVFLEAAASGVPQIAGKSGGAHEAVDHGATGTIVDNPKNVDEIVEALDELLVSVDLREEMSLAGRNRVCESLSYDILALRLEEALS